MIFTKEQIKRLPGSTVRLRDYPNHTVVVGEPSEVFSNFVSFRIPSGIRSSRGPTCFADTAKSFADSMDIVEVLQWADEKAKDPDAGTRLASPNLGKAIISSANSEMSEIITGRIAGQNLCVSRDELTRDAANDFTAIAARATRATRAATLEQLHDYHARMVEQLACEIYMQHVAKMKKAARLGVK